MAKVDLLIGGNSYTVACKDGEEAHLQAIAALVDKKAGEARKAVGGVSEARQLLFASLLLADELEETRRMVGAGAPVSSPEAPPAAPTGASDNDESTDLLEDIAARLESLALRLEQRG